MIVCCLNWRNYLGRGDEYVDALFAGVGRFAGCGHEFRVLSEDDVPSGADGWWNKIALFEPGLFPDGERIVYFDLDTLIVGDLTEILNYAGPLAGLRDFYHPNLMASGVMAWEAGKYDHIWEIWEASGKPQHDPRGDQGFLSPFFGARLQDEFPGQIVSFKAHCAAGIPTGARVVAFHGLPRPHTLHDIMTHW